MLPRLTVPPPDQRYRQFARQLRETGFAGDIHLDYSSRALQSTDNSIYQRFPEGVLYPANSDDLVRIAQLSQLSDFRSVAFCARGGGTGTNGQALGEGFVVDLSKHMNRILEINADEAWARVQAGVVKDQLNAALKSQGLFFAPDLSTSNRATIGGMINTDASGQGSCRYGKTRHHLLEIEMILSDGKRWNSRPLARGDFATVAQRQDRIGEIHRLTDSIHSAHRRQIEETFPTLNRSLTGYDLAHLRNEAGDFDLNSIICGSEGTLGFISEAVVKLERLPSHTALVVIEYSDFVDALRDARELIRARPTAIETIDNMVVELAKGDAIWPTISEFFSADPKQLKAANFVEFSAHADETLAAELEPFLASLGNGDNPLRLGHTVTRDPQAIAKIWAMRKRAVGLLGNMAGRARPLPFVEDTAVAPERLADYIAELRILLDERNLRYGMFGHADAGVIHVRPALDMRDASAINTVREVSDRVFALTQRYGGVLWGEHGKGLRSEYVPATFGELYPQLQRIKACFDPYNQLNPGKIATPSADQDLTRLDAAATRGDRDRLIPARVWDDYEDAVYCNGNAACFNWDPDQSMCPSWKGSRERKYSPKGRATLLKEWLAQLANQGQYPRRAAAQSESASNLFSRAVASFRKAAGQADFSHEVYDSMDTCLACKSCTTGCPVQVDVPAFRSVFFHYYFRRYLRPLRHYAVAGLETLLPLAAKAPRLYNLLTQPRYCQWLIARLSGLTALPGMSTCRFDRELEELGVLTARPESLQALSAQEKQRSIILVQDVFTRYFEADLILDLCRFLRCLGIQVWLAPYAANGKPLQVLGFLPAFEKVANSTADKLRGLAATGVALVGLEPSMTLTYRHEYRQSLEGETLAEVQLLQEWLVTQRSLLEARRAQFAPGDFRLLPHCSEAALAGSSLKQWQQIFTAVGSKLRIEQVGCCGMAGTYGHETRHVGTSENIYRQSWERKLHERAQDACASGFSCRCQARRFSGLAVPHPVQILLGQIRPR